MVMTLLIGDTRSWVQSNKMKINHKITFIVTPWRISCCRDCVTSEILKGNIVAVISGMSWLVLWADIADKHRSASDWLKEHSSASHVQRWWSLIQCGEKMWVPRIKCSFFLFRTVTCWHSTSQPITHGGANTGQAVWGARCRRLRGSGPQRASPISLSWAASWTTSTLRLHIVVHRFLLLWVCFSMWNANICMYEHVTGSDRNSGSHLPDSGIQCVWRVTMIDKTVKVVFPPNTFLSISSPLFGLLQAPFLCLKCWIKKLTCCLVWLRIRPTSWSWVTQTLGGLLLSSLYSSVWIQ